MGNTLPYLGVSGITKFNEACLIVEFFSKIFHSSDINYIPAIGFPMSRESSLPGFANSPYNNEYVSTKSLVKKLEKIILESKKIVRGIICYTSPEPEKLSDDIGYIYTQ